MNFIKHKLTPFTPFFSLSSINSERYSGDLGFKLKKCSKSDAIICLNILSLLNELTRKWSKRSFRLRRDWMKVTAFVAGWCSSSWLKKKNVDCVSYNIILQKFRYYNFSGNKVELLKFYLSNRYQHVVSENQYRAIKKFNMVCLKVQH